MTTPSSDKPAASSSWPGQPGRRPPHWWQTTAGRVVLGVVILLLVVWGISHRGGHGKDDADQAVPVVAATARQGTFVVYQSEPGTVTPISSVVVRSRVDGQLTRIAFSGGQTVKKGDLLAEIDPRPFQAQLELAKGDLARSQAQLANAQGTLEHYQTLLAQNSISRQRVDDQQSLVHQYSADVKSSQGRIDTANLQLANTRITSPIDGVVGLRQLDPGNVVSASDTRGIAVVTQSQPSKVIFAVPVAVVPHVLDRLHGGVCIPVDAYGDEPDTVLGTGRLLAANNQVDPATGTVKLEARFANTEGSLLPNQFVTVKLPAQILPQATLVPAAAIQHGAEGNFVYVVANDGTAKVTPVKIGAGDASTTVVTAGIAAGTKVVIEGADRLRAGSKVSVTAAPAPAPASTDVVPACHGDDAAADAAPRSTHSASVASNGRRRDSITRS